MLKPFLDTAIPTNKSLITKPISKIEPHQPTETEDGKKEEEVGHGKWKIGIRKDQCGREEDLLNSE